MKARLTRLRSGDHGTFGVLRFGEHTLLSIELPWRDNRQSVSCIPAGSYEVVNDWSPRFRRRMYRVLDVADRSGIRFHSGNLAGDRALGLLTHFSGCIGLGAKTGVLSAQRAVLQSARAVLAFEHFMGQNAFTLTIEDGYVG